MCEPGFLQPLLCSEHLGSGDFAKAAWDTHCTVGGDLATTLNSLTSQGVRDAKGVNWQVFFGLYFREYADSQIQKHNILESPMPDSLGVLQAERAKLLQQFLRLSDLRPGSITASVRPAENPPATVPSPTIPDTIHSSA